MTFVDRDGKNVIVSLYCVSQKTSCQSTLDFIFMFLNKIMHHNVIWHCCLYSPGISFISILPQQEL